MSKVALVVDDSMLIRYSVCSYLQSRGFSVESASNGSEALDVMARMKVDLIVTDMRMPKMTGNEFISALKNKKQTARIPIIVVTSKANGSCKPDERADFVIYKDIDVETQLGAALEAVMGDQSRGRGAGV